MTIDDAQPSEIESALPEAPQKRDLLGWTCFIIHFLPLIYVVTGWLSPPRWPLIVYLVFLPAMFLQWRLNSDSCILNNLESLIRTGRWRNPNNREEGAWLRILVSDVTGWHPSRAQMDGFINAVLVALWCVGVARLRGWFAI
jgi:hypothetical protein